MLLVPGLRLFPSASAISAGSAAWLSAPAGLPVLIIYSIFLEKLMSHRRNSEGLAELIEQSAGKIPLLISALWLLLYSAFVLRAGADRFITTVYPGSSPEFFVIIMGLTSLLAALGSVRSIVRTARMVFPFVFGTLLVILAFAFLSVEKQNILPVSVSDVSGVMKSSVSAIDVAVCVMYAVCFLESDTDKEPGRAKKYSLWAVLISLLLSLLSADIVGCFGSGLVSRLTRPFFSLVRNLVFFRTLERMEALVVALWVFPDFITASVFLYAAQYSIRRVFGFETAYTGQKLSDVSQGRYIIWFCAAASISIGIVMAPTGEILKLWSAELIPKLNMLYAFFFLPAVYLIGKRRKVI